jgi:hypothetical protein
LANISDVESIARVIKGKEEVRTTHQRLKIEIIDLEFL